MTPDSGRGLVAMAVLVALIAHSAARAGDAQPPVDEWWKRAKPPKRHGALTWSVGAFAGPQRWDGLDDYAPSDAERATGARGAWDTSSSDVGIVTWIEAARFESIGIGIDLFADTFSHETTELAYAPNPIVPDFASYSYDLRVRRLGVAARAIFLSDRRVQPTVSFGTALSVAAFHYDVQFQGSPGVMSGSSSQTTSIDFLLSGGFDVAFARNARRGLRGRVEVGLEHRGFHEQLVGFGGRSAGAQAYKATLGLLYRFEPARAAALAPPPPPPAEGKTTYSFIFDPANPALDLPADVQFMRPMALETKTLPIYPTGALAAHDTPHREVVRIVIDDHGNVGQVADSPMELSDDGPFAGDYRRAVDAAVRTWRFRPGVLQHVRDGEDKDGDGKADYKVMTSWDPVAVYYDIRFKFEILDGKGIVGVDDSKRDSR